MEGIRERSVLFPKADDVLLPSEPPPIAHAIPGYIHQPRLIVTRLLSLSFICVSRAGTGIVQTDNIPPN